jgi:hypothetical protein
MNRKVLLITLAGVIAVLVLSAAAPVPEKPMHEFTGNISCTDMKEGTSDFKENTHNTNHGKVQECNITADDAMAAGTMELKTLWSTANSKQNDAGYAVEKFKLENANGVWSGYQVTRVNNDGEQYVNGWANGISGEYRGLKMWFRQHGNTVITGWCTEHAPD